MRNLLLWSLFISAVSSSVAAAQTYYLPVQYQFGEHDRFYYGGTDARLLRYALASQDRTHREVTRRDEFVYSDAIGFQDARLFGYTASDARNEAYANVPTYFRMRDQLNAAIELPDGSRVVPTIQPASVPTRPTKPTSEVRTSAPTTRPIMIFPSPQQMPPPTSDHVKLVAN